MTMDLNSTINVTVDGATAINYKVITDAILLLTALSVIVFNLLVIAALIANSETVCSICWILGNILIACVVGALGSALNHIFRSVDVSDASFDAFTLCKVCLFAMGLGNSGRVLMATFYAITVFIVVRCWNKPVLAPRNTKYFIMGAMFVWLLVICTTNSPTPGHWSFCIL